MQVDVQSSALTSSPLALPLPRTPFERTDLVRATPTSSPLDALRQAQREAVQSHSLEQFVWLGLGLVAFALLVLSFYQAISQS